MFSQSIIEQLCYYVYLLRDPRDKEVFYIGKGKENRIFDHISASNTNTQRTEKLERIRDIQLSGLNVELFVIRHGLSEREALEIEATLIDFVGLQKLTNLQSGHNSKDFGFKSTEELIAIFSAPALETNEQVILININKLYHREMTKDEVYEATRQSWVLGLRRNKAKYVVATYRGLTREVYEIKEWFPVGKRWGFNGTNASEETQKQFRYKSTSGITKKGAANPIRYLNC